MNSGLYALAGASATATAAACAKRFEEPMTNASKWYLGLTRDSAGITALSVCWGRGRSEEHTSELQSRGQLVCRLLLEKKKEGCFLLRANDARNAMAREGRRIVLITQGLSSDLDT